MKNIFRYISILLFVGFAASSCEDNNNRKNITDLQEGVYIAGDATVYSAAEAAAEFGTVDLDPADQVVPGVSGIYTWLKANTPFYIIKVDDEGNQIQLGGGNEVTVSGAEGKTYTVAKNAKLSVEKEGFYNVIYNGTDNQITIVAITMSIIGDATEGKWDAGTAMGEPVYDETTSTVLFTMIDEPLNNKELKFRVGNNWQFGIPFGEGVATIAAGYGPETAADLGETSTECFSKPGLPSFKIAKAGLYDLTLTFELKSKKFMAKAVYTGENPDAPTGILPEKMFIIGDFCGWNWKNSPEMIAVNGHEGMFWGIYYMEAMQGFKFNFAKSWDGNDFGAENDDIHGYGEIPVGRANVKVENAGYYQILITCSVAADQSTVVKKIELMEPAVYLIGECAPDNSCSGPSPQNRFDRQGDLFVSPAVSTSSQLRMFVDLTGVQNWKWWQSEFIIYDGAIVYRGAGGDQEPHVAVTDGQIVKLNFKWNTGTIE